MYRKGGSMQDMCIFKNDDSKAVDSFYRKPYFRVRDLLQSENFIAIVGPRQVGKTVMMIQLANECGGNYVSFKSLPDNVSDDTFDAVLARIRNNEKTIEYLDEITYLEDYGRRLAVLCDAMAVLIAKGQTPQFHVIISGSQQSSILDNCSKAFGSRLKVVKIPYITFGEYLIYKKRLTWNSSFSLIDLTKTITEEDYIDYLFNSWKFDTSFSTPANYLMGCIEETVISEMKESWPSETSVSLDGRDLQNVLVAIYTILCTLHDNAKIVSYGDYYNLLKKIRMYYNQDHSPNIKVMDLKGALKSTHFYKYVRDGLRKDYFFKILRFLYEMEIIEFVKPMNDTELDDFFRGFVKEWATPDDFLMVYNPSFRNAQFFVAVLQEIADELQVNSFDLLNNALLGSLVECTTRSAIHNWLGDNTSKLHSDKNEEVDCIAGNFAIEISVSNKAGSELHYKAFPEINDHEKILLTNSVLNLDAEIKRIPYYVFIAHLDLTNRILD